MKLNSVMLHYIEKVIEADLQEAYPKTLPSADFKRKVLDSTLEGLKHRPNTAVSEAFLLASEELTTGLQAALAALEYAEAQGYFPCLLDCCRSLGARQRLREKPGH